MLLIAYSFNICAQEYDLVVTNTGDSIACNIDSTAGQKVYFEMKFKGEWRHTYMNKEDIILYEHDALYKDSIKIKSNSTFIKYEKKKFQFDRPKNNISLMFLGYASLISANVERSFFINQNLFINAKMGVGYNQEPIFIGIEEPYKYVTYPHHLTVNIGRYRNFIEFGFGGTYIEGNTSQHYLFYQLIGYRLQPVNYYRVTCRAFIHFTFNPDIEDILIDSDVIFFIFGISYGFCF